MDVKEFKRCLVISIFLFVLQISFGQTVPLGIFYQAVARDNFGKELTNRNIDVKFSILAGNPLGEIVYQELHADVTTTRYGVFSLVIGKGVPTGGTFGELSQISWSGAYHYLRVEVKFDNDFIDMGTMQFLAVPYALYAQKSLEPGPAGTKGDTGEKGDPGDPASDDQTISFDQSILAINGGNSVPLTSLLQSLTITTSQEGNYLGISRGNSVLLATIEADGDPENELQDITISSDILKITNNASATEWDLTRYLDNTDNQALSWNPVDRLLSVSGNAGTINLSELKDDADADPTNEIQDLILTSDKLTITDNTSATEIDLVPYLDNTDNQEIAYDPATYDLSISGGNSVNIGSLVAFRAGIDKSVDLPSKEEVDLIFNNIEGAFYSDGDYYNSESGVFRADFTGIYSFDVSLVLPVNSYVIFKVNDFSYENIIGQTSSEGNFRSNITLKLNIDDLVNIAVYNNNGYLIPYTFTGSFSGYRVY
jgi:C1q domain-containing protein